MDINGWPISVIVRGQTVMRDGEMLGAPVGKLVRFA
jgi:dihydroorotase